MHVDVVRPADLGDSEIDLWGSIQAENDELDSPFLSAQFTRALAGTRDGVRVAVLSEGGDVVAFFPFEQVRGGRGRAVGMGLSDVQAVIAPATLDLDIRAVMQGCGLRLFSFDHLVAAQEKWMTSAPSRFFMDSSPVLDLTGGFDTYLSAKAAASKSLFQSTARKRRKLEREHGPVRVVYHEPRHDVLERLLQWKSAQYRRTGRRDRFADQGNRRLVHELLAIAEAGFGAPLTALYAGDSLVAAHLGLSSNRTLAWWFPAYDPDFAAYSPGLVLCLGLARVMSDERGLTLLDLGKGDEPYKDRLSNARVHLLAGSVASTRATQAMHTARGWPGAQLTNVVLGSPPLRKLSRNALAQVGQLREHLARRE